MAANRVAGALHLRASCRGGLIWTRGHVPSRILLDEPYPPNLPVVVACETCNKSFSIGEEYVACLVDCTVAGSTEPQLLPRPKVRRIMQEKPALRKRIEQSRRMVDDRVQHSGRSLWSRWRAGERG